MNQQFRDLTGAEAVHLHDYMSESFRQEGQQLTAEEDELDIEELYQEIGGEG